MNKEKLCNWIFFFEEVEINQQNTKIIIIIDFHGYEKMTDFYCKCNDAEKSREA